MEIDSAERFDEAVAIVRQSFPHLTLEIDRTHPQVHALAELPAQAGLDFDVSFNLQNGDELHLNVSRLWVEWFPCTKQEVMDRFTDALIGLLSGRYRVLESDVGGSFATARLQRPVGDGRWVTISRRANLRALMPWPRVHTVVQNRPSA